MTPAWSRPQPGTDPSRRRMVMGSAAGVAAAAMGGVPGLAQSPSPSPSPGQAPAPQPAAAGSERRILWAATVRSKPFEERLAAARAHGFTHLSMFPIDYRKLLDTGRTPAQIKAQVRASGVRIVACDPYTRWVPGWKMPEGYPPDYRAFVDYDEAFIFGMADTLGAEAINCVEPFGVRYPAAQLADALGRFAERAGRNGLRVTLEFMPISGIPDLAAGWDILRAAPVKNLGMTFDTWHFFRSTPDLALLARIPGERVFEVQLADAKKALQGDLVSDLLKHRLLPGEGEFDITGVVAALKRIGAYRSVGPEIFADAFDALSTDEAARRAAANLKRWV